MIAGVGVAVAFLLTLTLAVIGGFIGVALARWQNKRDRERSGLK